MTGHLLLVVAVVRLVSRLNSLHFTSVYFWYHFIFILHRVLFHIPLFIWFCCGGSLLWVELLCMRSELGTALLLDLHPGWSSKDSPFLFVIWTILWSMISVSDFSSLLVFQVGFSLLEESHRVKADSYGERLSGPSHFQVALYKQDSHLSSVSQCALIPPGRISAF